jgi:4-aminobutyrate aminotransferase-like enzyme/Ser/Thr protein kinase RdoA (MazF antagonist)
MKQAAPPFSADDAVRAARINWGLVCDAEPLPGEHDASFLLGDGHGARWVLKVSHAAEQPEVLELQANALRQLAERAPTLDVPRIVPDTNGEAVAQVAGMDGASYHARLLTYVPGKALAHVRPHSPALLRSVGALLGEVDAALQGLAHPAARREFKWDVAQAGWVREQMGVITDVAHRSLVARCLARFESEAVPALAALRHSVIHGDANDYNVLVSAAPGDALRATGLVDFGDLIYSATICDLAIACAYAMLDKPDPLAAMEHVAAGFHAALPLREDELAVLYPLIGARLCVSVTNSAYQRQADPDNAYLQVSDRPAWALLERLATVQPGLAYYHARHACGYAPCPSTPRVATWLRAQGSELASLLDPPLDPGTTTVLDLSVGSRDLGNVPDFADASSFARRVGERLGEAGVRTGIGRYGEARYPRGAQATARREGNDGPEWRTVSLAMDLFLEAGTLVCAPLDGSVHSVRRDTSAAGAVATLLLEHRAGKGGPRFYTLYGPLAVDAHSGPSEGAPVARGQCLGAVYGFQEPGGGPARLRVQLVTDLLGMGSDFPSEAFPSERDMWLGLSPDPNLILRLPVALVAGAEPNVTTLLEARRAIVGPNLSVSYRRPLHIVRGYRQYLYAVDGQAYLDGVNNVAHVGHSHPDVVRAAQRQLAVLNTNTRYLHAELARYAERLTAMLPDPLRVCYFVNSGSEANELALRLARTYTGRRDVLVLDAAYHGNTSTLVEISPYKYKGPGGVGRPDYVHEVPLPDCYRGLYGGGGTEVGARYAGHVAEAMHAAEPVGGAAAFICESLPGCGGQIVLPAGYVAAAYAAVRSAGGVCIADEVQTGLGRVGTHFWGFETQGVVPDIVTLGKPIGNGHPLGAVVTTPEIAAAFDNGMEYFNTFGGNPVSCATGQAVLDVIEREGLQERARVTGARLLSGLAELMERHILIGDVRGLGLFLGVELVLDREARTPAPAQAAYVANRLRERGILLSTDGPAHNVLKIKPPLVFDEHDAERLLAQLDVVLCEDLAQAEW